ncbi:30S ribosomal protein S4e [Halobium salinum]|uniref:Small ribosomal subunit protein eS4 n=1 Tax=Halobium salinum TaxID=1364940 RepID=A0ABD5P8S7_9EURY|nr:30S ribosomal protein S4e [Halobium salinum]
MTKHQKRLSVPNSWPVERKEETFTVKAGAGPHGEAGVPLVIVLRDVLGYVDSVKEARYALNQGTVLVNGDAVSDHRRPIGMFDIIAFTERGEYYRVFPDEGGRLALTPIDEGDAESRLGKVVGKRNVPGGDVQLSLHDGTTLVVDDDAEYAGGDSLVVDSESKDVVAHFVYEEGALVTAVDGAHAGKVGTLDEIRVTPGSGSNTVSVSQDEGDGFETVEEYLVVIDENFVGDEEDAVTTTDTDDDSRIEAADESEDEDEVTEE